MEQFTTAISGAWESFSTNGTLAVQSITYKLSGYEINEVAALAVLIGASVGFTLWLLMMLKRPAKKPTYLMESASRYHRY